MSQQVVSELVNQYTDDFLFDREVADMAGSKAARPDDADLLKDLFRLVGDLSALLTPANPSPEFISQLGQSLAAAASPAEIEIGPGSNRKLWIGAILSGSFVSAVGVLLVWFIRHRRGAVAAS